ncbi:MAG: CopG family transcriptional regulator [Chloroflexota bacterium]
MKSIKTAISIQKPLFEQVDTLARALNISRSRVFVLAVEEFIHRYQNQQLLEEINQAFDDLPNAAEKKYLNKTRQHHRNMADGEW